jgi:ATP-dependent DNA helicase 2 subunit 2
LTLALWLIIKQYERYLDMSKTHVIIAQRTNEKAIMALSSFIRALYELETYAVARLVPKDGKSPTMILLAPSIDADAECLFEVELPFAEDLRSYRFPALDKIVTVSGKELKQHRYLPSDDLMDAMSDYVDAMDLSTFGEDDEGKPSEYATIEDTFSPALHRISQVIRSRAIWPDEKLPPVPEILVKYSNPPQDLINSAKASLKAIATAADVKKGRCKQDVVAFELILTIYSTTKVEIEERTPRCPEATFWTRYYCSSFNSG